jgi:hypothetical protein
LGNEKEEETREKGVALRKRRDFDEFICCVDKMRRERNIGKRKRSQKR